jgi:hypothetical protein
MCIFCDGAFALIQIGFIAVDPRRKNSDSLNFSELWMKAGEFDGAQRFDLARL